MHRTAKYLPTAAILGCLVIVAAGTTESLAWESAGPDFPSLGDEQASQDSTQSNPQGEPERRPESKTQLGPEMAALRDRVRQTLAANLRRQPSTGDNTPAELIDCCLAFGCDATVRHAGTSGGTLNAFGCLAWNFPSAGYRLLRTDGTHFLARIGYGLQQRPGQFLAVLAQSGVPADYELRVGEARGTVADLIEYEKLTCQSGTDLSNKLIGLAFYEKEDRTWQNETGEDWSLDRMVQEELARQVAVDDVDATYRLLGLSYAVQRRIRRGQPVDGQFLRAEDYTLEYRDYVLELQNPDGSWHPRFFAVTGASNDTTGLLRSNGQILEWLVLCSPKERLADPSLVRSVGYVTTLLSRQSAAGGSVSGTPRQIAARMHALRALSLYDQRLFEPLDP